MSFDDSEFDTPESCQCREATRKAEKSFLRELQQLQNDETREKVKIWCFTRKIIKFFHDEVERYDDEILWKDSQDYQRKIRTWAPLKLFSILFTVFICVCVFFFGKSTQAREKITAKYISSSVHRSPWGKFRVKNVLFSNSWQDDK